MDEKGRLPLKAKPAGNFLEYVRERMDTFDERPLCAVDSLVFSWLSYAHIGPELTRACTVRGIALRELLRAEDFGGMFGSSWDEQGSRDLLFAVCASPRFRTCRLCDLRFRTDKVSEEQFAAMTFRLPDGTSYIAFRGTDSTVVGWKEDFNMTYLSPVPAQEEAAAYLDEVAARTPGELYVGGHSKGATLRSMPRRCACHSIVRASSASSPMMGRDFTASSARATPIGASCPSWRRRCPSRP